MTFCISCTIYSFSCFLDIDECLLKTDLCKTPAKCRNTKGDYWCECPTGYQLNATNDCVGEYNVLFSVIIHPIGTEKDRSFDHLMTHDLPLGSL